MAYYVVPLPVPGRRGEVYASRLPGFHRLQTEAELDAIEALGVERVVCLVPEAVLHKIHLAGPYLRSVRARFGPRFRIVAVEDHQVPETDEPFEQAVADVDAALSRGEQVLVHCVGGCGRTGMFVSCVLVRAGLEPREAIAHFRRHRRCGPETAHQVAYVFRYAARRAAGRTASPRDAVTIHTVRDAAGVPVELGRGGLSRVLIGRLRLPGTVRRVALKCFRRRVDAAEATRMQDTIDRLRARGVQLPKMVMLPLPDGQWVQVTPLFGSRRRGSKLSQPGMYYQRLSRENGSFAIDQLARVAAAGHMPSLDLFLVLDGKDGEGIVPMDLDLVLPESDLEKRARKLISCVLQIGKDARDRDRLLEVALAVVDEPMQNRLTALRSEEDSPFRRYWEM